MSRQLTPAEVIEQSIVRRYHERLWSPFCQAVKRYELIRPNDRIAVFLSGGQTGMLLAKMLQMLHRHTKVPFDVLYLIPGPGGQDRQSAERAARILEIPCAVCEAADGQGKGLLSLQLRKKARELGCGKIALSHHYDDVIGAALRGMLYGGQLRAMAPRMKAEDDPAMEWIRPLYLVRGQDIAAWKDASGLSFLSDTEPQEESGQKEVRDLIQSLKKENPAVERNIFSSIHRLKLDTMAAWTYRGKTHSFLEDYAQRSPLPEND